MPLGKWSADTRIIFSLMVLLLNSTLPLMSVKEKLFIDLVSDVTAEIELGSLLQRVMVEATKMLNADRATLFLHDSKTSELFSQFQ